MTLARTIPGIGILMLSGVSGVAMGATLCVGTGSGCYSTISAAVAAGGDTINVSLGIYREQVTILHGVSLVALNPQATVIDATGLPNGIFINGMVEAPQTGAGNILVSGFTIRNANFEGILVANADSVTLLNNRVLDNNKSLDISAMMCPGQPSFETSEGDDCGEGIHLSGVEHSLVAYNVVQRNSGGILISDDTGPTHDNLITGNIVQDNPYDCGITLASHPSYLGGGLPFGVTHDTISQNVSTHNGFLVPGAGAGVGIFAPGPGNINTGNVVINNDLRNNGLPGVTMHNHAAPGVDGVPVQAPPVNMDDNVIVGNRISGNGADTADAATSGPTGINLFSVAPVDGTVISQNIFDNETIDIAISAPSGQTNVHLNNFDIKDVGVETYGAGTIQQVNATQNWWGCPTGPGTDKCATAVGSTVTFAPWLFFPVHLDNGGGH